MTDSSPTPWTAGADDEQAEQRAVEERNRSLARAGVARAEDLLVHRYRLASRGEAFDLLRRTSQRFNIKVHLLAESAVRLPAPQAGADRWVPRRPQAAAPPPAALHAPTEQPAGHSAVLRAALDRPLRITGAEMGNVQTVENGMLRMEKHTGLNRRFTDYFTFVEDSTTSCAQAAAENRQVTVKDVAASDAFDEGSRRAILQTGSRACHSVPLPGPAGTVVGMISSHHDQPLHGLSPVQLAALDELGGQVGRWLVWHRNTVVLAALNHPHTTATV
ncbi:ANTAR domain-containing protein [Streptomyces sp. NPDC006743]|uniref:ANTAR domain-containing protein n=1 Tax=Streptomyces sp. NPDC006743 TaxID=3154480 RepID=UPI00345285AE